MFAVQSRVVLLNLSLVNAPAGQPIQAELKQMPRRVLKSHLAPLARPMVCHMQIPAADKPPIDLHLSLAETVWRRSGTPPEPSHGSLMHDNSERSHVSGFLLRLV